MDWTCAPPQNWFELAIIYFLNQILVRFGVQVKVLIDQGWEFLEAFGELCVLSFNWPLYHLSMQEHLEVDGLVEKVVQTMKCGFYKYGLVHGNNKDWDFKIPWISI